MRIDAQFFGLDRTGGTLVLLRYLFRAIESGHEVHITTLGQAGDSRFVSAPGGADVSYLGLRRPLYRGLARVVPGDLGFPRWELRRLRHGSRSADLRLASYTFTVLSSMGAGDPVHHHVQHMETLLEPTQRRRALVLDGLRADVYRTANCTWVADQVDAVGGRIDGIVTPGIDLDVFCPENDASYEGLRGGSSALRIITLGKSVAWKGLSDVVAGAGLVGSAREVELVTYGPNRPSVPSSLAHRHFGFIGAVELAALYRSSDVCVVGSWYESFPLPPLEAMACGTPVICTRLGTEDYAVHEENCLIVSPKRPDQIAAAVTRLADDAALRSHLVRNGLATAAQHGWAPAESRFLDHMAQAALG